VLLDIKRIPSHVKRTIIFMVILSLVCALILSVLASALRVPQEVAKELDRSTQMLIAARIVSPFGYFQVQNEKGEFVPAKFTADGTLEPTEEKIPATRDQILDVYRKRIQPFLVNDKGEETTFQEAGMDEQDYTADYRKTGYYLQPWKLIYKIFPNSNSNEANDQKQVEGYVIPVNGMGLWDAIYGYLAIRPDGNTVIGISWYDQKETPGLGANISEAEWQSQFPGKHIFQEGSGGKTDFATAPIGITVVKGKVSEVYGNSPKALSAVDGMAGATLTGNGVTDAYKNVLSAYRPFLLRVHGKGEKGQETQKRS
jgi:Na+-transporting NADH:ubiquinone oxidoreductase subunit C